MKLGYYESKVYSYYILANAKKHPINHPPFTLNYAVLIKLILPIASGSCQLQHAMIYYYAEKQRLSNFCIVIISSYTYGALFAKPTSFLHYLLDFC